MGLSIDKETFEEIRRHAAREYPSECCGAMLGVAVDQKKDVLLIEQLRNLRKERTRANEILPLGSPESESERNRFLIEPADIMRVEKLALAKGLSVVGFYHSHPDHPAKPSGYDLSHAFPWYSYAIIKVEAGEPGLCTSWVLREDRTQFDKEDLSIVSEAAPGEVTGAGLRRSTKET